MRTMLGRKCKLNYAWLRDDAAGAPLWLSVFLPTFPAPDKANGVKRNVGYRGFTRIDAD